MSESIERLTQPALRLEVPARYRQLSAEQIARQFRADMPTRFDLGERETPPEMRGAVSVIAAVAIRCTAGDCHGLAGYFIRQRSAFAGATIIQNAYLAPPSYVEREPGVFALGSRADQRAKRGQNPHYARRKVDRRGVLVGETPTGWNQPRPFSIPNLPEIIVRCPDCKANRWIRVDVAEGLRYL